MSTVGKGYSPHGRLLNALSVSTVGLEFSSNQIPWDSCGTSEVPELVPISHRSFQSQVSHGGDVTTLASKPISETLLSECNPPSSCHPKVVEIQRRQGMGSRGKATEKLKRFLQSQEG